VQEAVARRRNLTHPSALGALSVTSISLPRVPRWSLPPGVQSWAARNSFALRLTASLAAIACAYHYSLMSLVRALGLETPLAYRSPPCAARR
jgi:hypothetical protein